MTVRLALILALLLPTAAAAQTEFRSTAALGTGGGGPAFVREVDAIFLNPANLAFQERGDRAVVTIGRAADRLGGDLLQGRFYNDYLTGGQVLDDQRAAAMLDGWFGDGMRSIRNTGEVVLAAFTLHGNDRGYGGGLRLRSYVEGRLDRGLFEVVLGGMEENRTVPINAAVNSFTTMDLSVGMGFRVNPELTVGISPKLIMGVGYTRGDFTSDLIIDDYSLTHRYDYQFQTAGSDAFFTGKLSPFADNAAVGLDLGAAGYGAGFDAGATYQLNDEIDLSASVTDLGFVRWSSDSRTVTPRGSSFQLEELQVDPRTLKQEYDGEIGKYMIDVVDSLVDESYGQYQTTDDAFTSGLPTAFHLGGMLTKGSAAFVGGLSTGFSRTGGFVRTPTAYVGTELRVGGESIYLPLRAGLRVGGNRAMGISGGLGLHTPIYDFDIGAAFTPHSTFLGRGAQVAVSMAALTVRI